MSIPNDIGSAVVANKGYFKPQTMTNATFIVGEEIDLQAAGAEGYQSALAVLVLAFTSSSGNSTGKVSVAIQAYDDTVTGMGSEAAFGDPYSYDYEWAADGANAGVHCLPLDLRLANRFLRVKAKITKSGTITVASELGSLAVILGGMRVTPDAEHVAAGYENTSEAA
jgi:hypothetical protein